MRFLKDWMERNNKYSRKITFFIQFLILQSLVCFSIETIPSLSKNTQTFLTYAEIVTVILFTIEYGLRLIYAEKKLRFIFSFYGLIDLLAILPFYIFRGFDFRFLRIFRLFRLFRAFKLLRYNSAIERFKKAFSIIKEELIIFLVATAFLLFVSAAGIYYFENDVQPDKFQSLFHCLWWAMVTLTTVGYGDAYPITIGGRIFTFLILILGLGIFAVPSGLIASAMTQTIKEKKHKASE